jgi:hypothetical protein
MTELHLLDVNISWMNENIYIGPIAPFQVNSVMLPLSEFHLCLAWNYDYDDKTRGLSWAISLVGVNCAVDRHLTGQWLSASLIIRIALALSVNIFLWLKFFPPIAKYL